MSPILNMVMTQWEFKEKLAMPLNPKYIIGGVEKNGKITCIAIITENILFYLFTSEYVNTVSCNAEQFDPKSSFLPNTVVSIPE